MDSEQFKRIQRRAMHVARSYGYPHEADDFAQEAALAVSRGSKATTEQLFIDYLRAQYGRTGPLGTAKGRSKSFARHNSVSLDAPVSRENETTLNEIIAAPGGDPRPNGSNWRSRVTLGGRRAAICELRYDHEMSEREIAEAYGVTEARISQELKVINKEIAKAATLDEVADIYRDDKEYSKLRVDWIKL